ncbi:MAG: hypothetical protein ACE5KG_05165, partial [Nitrososphaerales archaeon]
MLTNYSTNPKMRSPSDKDISLEERNKLVQLAEDKIASGSEVYLWNANVQGIVLQLKTNNFHLYDFWVENWYAAPRTQTVLPHGLLYAVTGVEGMEPHAYYHHDTKTAIFINTDYYGQCKSWALGIATDIMELQHKVYPIHGSCAVLGEKGVVLIAPTGTGKTTHTFGLLELPDSKIHSDDWIFVTLKKGLAMAAISERKFYVRTDLVKSFPDYKKMLELGKCENVDDGDFTKFGNSRAILDPVWIGGPDKFVDQAVVNNVILLRRDKESPPEVKLDADTAVDILEEGKYQVLSGAGANVGSYSNEPFYTDTGRIHSYCDIPDTI